MEKLRALPLALGIGMTWGLGILLLGWIAGSGWGIRAVEVLSSVYRGYAPTLVGGLIGGLWAFGDGFVAGLLFAFSYNIFAARTAAEKLPLSIRSPQ